MILSRCSLKSLVTMFTMGIGLISLILALLTGNVYRDQTLKDDLKKSREDLRLKSEMNMHRLRQHVLQFGTILRNRPELQRLLAARDWAGLDALLRGQLGSAFAASGVLNIAQINLYDARLRLRSRADKPATSALNSFTPDCGPPLHARIKPEAGAATVGHALCRQLDHLYLSVALPIGAGREPAYLEVLAEMGYAMELLEEEAGMPLRLRAGEPPSTVYRSPRWPEEKKLKDTVIVSLDFPVAGTPLPLRLDAAHDHALLFASLRRTSFIVAAGTGAVLLAIILMMLAVARRALLDPVRDIIEHMRHVRRNRTFLRERIAPRGIAEIRELADDFNAMSGELERLYQTLETMASTDTLTRLGNRKRFHHDLATLVGTAERRSTPFALLILDLDKFKMINDTLGHKAGDQFLQQISERFRNELRDTDLLVTAAGHHHGRDVGRYLSRLGGDEFAVLLPGVTDETSAVTVARKLAAVAASPFIVEGTEVNIGVSIGIAFYPKDSADEDTLIHLADLAMYHAKRMGTGYAVYDREMGHADAGNSRQNVFRTASNKY